MSCFSISKIQNSDDLIADANKCIEKYCNDTGSKNRNWWKGFGSGVGAMFGLSGIQGCGMPGDDASSLLSLIQTIAQDNQTQNQIKFNTTTVTNMDKFYQDLQLKNQAIKTHLQGLDDIIKQNNELNQVEILGSYLLIFLILFYILLT